MNEEIKGKCYQEYEPTPDDPCEIKTIVCNGIEIPVEFLKQNFVTVDGKKYIELQQENIQLKENNMSMQEEMARTWEKEDLYKEVVEEVREYVDKEMFDYLETPGLLQILDKIK